MCKLKILVNNFEGCVTRKMEGSKLTEKQKKIALNVQKKQKTPRNVLTSSLPEYWPCLKDEEINEFQEILKK